VEPFVGLAITSRKATGTSSTVGSWPTISLQSKPSSISQMEEQPSPSVVLPSSQSSMSLGRMSPSPHAETHGPALQLGSTSQNGLQPSPMSSLPSSQGSSPSLSPSLQSVG
jgi:hypothetical protein